MHVNARPVARKHAGVRDGIGFRVTIVTHTHTHTGRFGVGVDQAPGAHVPAAACFRHGASGSEVERDPRHRRRRHPVPLGGRRAGRVSKSKSSRKKLAAVTIPLSAGWWVPPLFFLVVFLTIGQPVGGRSMHEDSQHAEHNEQLGQARGWKGGRHHDDELIDAHNSHVKPNRRHAVTTLHSRACLASTHSSTQSLHTCTMLPVEAALAGVY